MRKRVVALFLALALAATLCPAVLAASTLKASEATTTVEKKLAELQTQSGFRPGDASDNCFTFAMSVTNKIFGFKLTDIEYHGEKERSSKGSKSGCLVRIGRCYQAHSGYTCKYSSSGATALNETNVKSLLKQAKCGDIIQTTRKTSAGHNDDYANSNCETRHPHTMVVQSVGENSLVVYEGNMNGDKVNVRSISYKDFASTYNHTITLFRAENYDKINGGSSVVTNAPSTLTISPTTEPGFNMPQGKPFYFKGKITSSQPIASATISILSAFGETTLQAKTIKPNTTTVDIATSGLDALKFGQLAPGSYLFYLTVTDQSGKSATWRKDFSIAGSAPATSTAASAAPAASTLTITPINTPGQNMKLGETFNFTAKFTSNYNVTSAQLDILEEGKSGIKQAHALLIDPSQKEVNYSTSGLTGIRFDRLLAGSYRLRLTVKDSSGATKQWEHGFTIVDPTPKTYTIKIHYTKDGVGYGAATLTVNEGETRTYETYMEGIPSKVVMDSGVWDGARTLTFSNVRNDIEAHVYYETSQEETPTDDGHTLTINYHIDDKLVFTDHCPDGVGDQCHIYQMPEAYQNRNFWYSVDVSGILVLDTEIWVIELPRDVTLNLYCNSDNSVPEDFKPFDDPTPAPSPSADPEPTTEPEPATKPDPEPTAKPDPEPTPTASGGLKNFYTVKTYYTGTFDDVNASDWFDENVGRAYELGLMNGVGGGAFNPKASVTVAEAIALAARLHSIYYTDSDQFVQSGDNWYDCYVTYAKDNGILRGLDFDYSVSISRQSFSYILAASMPKEALPDISDGNIQFDDNDMFDSRMADSVYQLAKAGIIRGIPNIYGGMDFAPNSSITRAEVAAIVTRMADPSLR